MKKIKKRQAKKNHMKWYREHYDPEGVVTLCIAHKGLETMIWDYYIKEDVEDPEAEGYFKPNLSWEDINIKRKDIDEYIELTNQQLRARWTPNQDEEDREYFEKVDQEAGIRMQQLIIK